MTTTAITVTSVFVAGEVMHSKGARSGPSNGRFNTKSIMAQDNAKISKFTPILVESNREMRAKRESELMRYSFGNTHDREKVAPI